MYWALWTVVTLTSIETILQLFKAVGHSKVETRWTALSIFAIIGTISLFALTELSHL